MTVISLVEYRTARAIPVTEYQHEPDGSVWRGLFFSFLIEGSIAALIWAGWSLGQALLP